MNKLLSRLTVTLFVFLYACYPVHVMAAPPKLLTPPPVIYLADNLDEQEQLGWCIDTRGRGFSDRLHAHSCKKRGGDVQFSYTKKTGLIKSATFKDKCLARLSLNLETRFGLLDCDASSDLQTFNYINSTKEFRPKNQDTSCIAVGKISRKAGPFMSRNLFLAECNLTEPKYKEWLIKEN